MEVLDSAVIKLLKGFVFDPVQDFMPYSALWRLYVACYYFMVPMEG